MWFKKLLGSIWESEENTYGICPVIKKITEASMKTTRVLVYQVPFILLGSIILRWLSNARDMYAWQSGRFPISWGLYQSHPVYLTCWNTRTPLVDPRHVNSVIWMRHSIQSIVQLSGDDSLWGTPEKFTYLFYSLYEKNRSRIQAYGNF